MRLDVAMSLLERMLARFRATGSGPDWPPPQISVALQGGGSFGAFASGVLDSLLEKTDVAFDAVSGASAGAVNAVLLAYGLLEGGRDGARARLKRFWRKMSDKAALHGQAALAATPLDFALRTLSPYQFNPLNLNPLRDALNEEVDFARLRAEAPIRLLVGATRVSDGRQRIFRERELTADMVLASACLPLLHHAIEIDGEAFWDGGYSANPPLFPLVLNSQADDVLVVLVTPNVVDRTPMARRDIVNRLEQIQFNATVNAEFEALRLGAILRMSPKFSRLRLSRLAAEEEVEGLARESAGNLRRDFIDRLFEAGRAAGESWIERRVGAPRTAPPADRRGLSASV